MIKTENTLVDSVSALNNLSSENRWFWSDVIRRDFGNGTDRTEFKPALPCWTCDLSQICSFLGLYPP